MPKATPWPAVMTSGATAFVVLLLLLHLLRPDLEPSWRFISEYALGDHGWLMTVAFGAWGVSFLAAAVGVRASIRGKMSWVAAALLVVSGLSAIAAAIFPTDPLDTAGHAQASFRGAVHNAAGAAGIVIPIAIALATSLLWRSPDWHGRRVPLAIAAGLAVLGFVVSFASLAVLLSASGGRFGPDVPVGWPNRLEVLGYSLWLVVFGRSAHWVLKRPDSRLLV